MNRDNNIPPDRLRILQINLNKSEKAHLDLINSALGKYWDVILIQEPYLTFLGHIQTPNGFVGIYPTDRLRNQENIVRSVIWINSSLSTNSWKAISIPGNNDLTAVQFRHRNNSKLTIFNIYNDCTHSNTLTHLQQFMNRERNNIITNENDHMIWSGDFNRHHPLWDNKEDDRLFTPQALQDAAILIEMVDNEGLDMALPKGEPTLKHMVTKLYSRPDNVWCSTGLMPKILKCEVDPYLQPPCTDHFPIATILEINQERVDPQPTRNFRTVDWQDFTDTLQNNLKLIPNPRPLEDEEELQEAARNLTEVLQKTIVDAIPISKPCPHSKRWWTSNLQALKKKLNKISRTAMKQRAVEEHPIHDMKKKAAKEYSEAIINAKKQHWTQFLENASDFDLWTTNRYLKNPLGDGGKPRTPTLKTKDENGTIKEISTNEDKAKAFNKVFFPPKPDISTVPEDFQYPPPLPDPSPITREQIRKHVISLSPYKASGPDNIPNIVLQKSLDHIEIHLIHLFRSILRLGAYIDEWKEFTTVVLRKPGKPNYEEPKAYRPIALLCTLAKVLTAIVAEDITYLVEKEQLLPTNHYGGRPGRMTTDAVHALVDKVKSAWRRGKVVSILYLDVEGAFPNAVTDRLIHNLRRRKIPLVYTRFVEQLLKGRRTRIKFDDFLSDPIQISNGIGQGDPLSMILYIIYNADFLELASNTSEDSLGFVDDAMAMVESKSFKENNKKLTKFMNRRNGGFEWSKDHNSKFAIDKLAVTHFTRKRTPDPQNPKRSIPTPIPPLKLQGKTVRVENSYKYLGIHVDHQLRWNIQTHKAIAKATKWTLLFRRLTKVASGLSAKLMRRLYITVAIPKMTYGLDVWYTPPSKPEGKKNNTGSVKALKELSKLQRLATIAINGAFKSSPTDLLDAHSGLLPVSLLLKSICYRSITRICTLPKSNPVSKQATKYYNKPAKTHKTNIQLLIKLFNIDPTTYEIVPPVSRPPVHDLPIESHIAENKEKAIEEEAKDEATIRIYTDGSSQDGYVGAAAVLYKTQNNTITNPPVLLRYRLGSDKEHTVWDAEVTGGILALWLLKDYNRISRQPITIYTDNQAFIKAFKAQKATKGYHLIREFTRLADQLVLSSNPPRNPEKIALRWIAAHKDVKGNEAADTEAKKAAAGESSPLESLPPILRTPLPRSANATKSHFKSLLKDEWQALWEKSPRKARIEKFDESFPFNKHRSFIETLTRIQSSMLFQIRSNHLPLNCYLHRIGAVPSEGCDNCRTALQEGPKETVTHFLFECPKYNRERQDLDTALGPLSRDLKEILSDIDRTRELLKYIGRTKRFEALGDIAHMREPPPDA